jgi:DnaD/phage-associated family protein
VQLTGTPPNIFKLYEDNIGPITPMMAEILKADEAEYPPDWIEEAIRSAVAHNARSWKYVQAILKRRQKEGHRDEQHRRNDSQDPESYRERWLRNDRS